jgi:hypothetical protein
VPTNGLQPLKAKLELTGRACAKDNVGEALDSYEMSLPIRQRLAEEDKSNDIQTDGKRLMRVKVIGGRGTADRVGMAVVLAKDRRIELSRDFDPVQLRRVVEALE